MFPEGEHYLDLEDWIFRVLTSPSNRPRRGLVPTPSNLDAAQLHT